MSKDLVCKTEEVKCVIYKKTIKKCLTLIMLEKMT